MRRYRIVVTGKVQGCGFRYFCYKTAKSCGVTGWVMNERDYHMVTMEVQGEDANLDLFTKLIEEGNRYSRMDELHREEKPVDVNEHLFEVRRGW